MHFTCRKNWSWSEITRFSSSSSSLSSLHLLAAGLLLGDRCHRCQKHTRKCSGKERERELWEMDATAEWWCLACLRLVAMATLLSMYRERERRVWSTREGSEWEREGGNGGGYGGYLDGWMEKQKEGAVAAGISLVIIACCAATRTDRAVRCIHYFPLGRAIATCRRGIGSSPPVGLCARISMQICGWCFLQRWWNSFLRLLWKNL